MDGGPQKLLPVSPVFESLHFFGKSDSVYEVPQPDTKWTEFGTGGYKLSKLF